jgi:hypothetical protein
VPTPRAGYCSPDDLLIGDVTLPSWLTREQIVAAAADEMDSKLGLVYAIPVPAAPGIDPDNPIPVVVDLFLKRINYTLGSGRAILQLDASGENERLHAYGLSLVQEANEALDQLVTGQIILENVPGANPDTDPIVSGPMISNVDVESNVEAFYDRIANPRYVYPYQFGCGVPRGDGYWPPEGLVRQ